MADTDSNASGATLPPSRSPSTVAPFPQTNHLQPQPVSSRVYHAIAETTSGFEKLMQDLQALQQVNFFPAGNLTAWLNIVLQLQAETNSRLLESLSDREMKNAAYYDRLCMEWERQLEDPDVALIAGYHRKAGLLLSANAGFFCSAGLPLACIRSAVGQSSA